MIFIRSRKFPSTPSLLSIFPLKGVGFIKHVFHIYLNYNVDLYLLLMWYMIIFCMLNHPCIPRLNPTWLCIIIFICFCICYLAFFSEILYFLVCVCVYIYIDMLEFSCP